MWNLAIGFNINTGNLERQLEWIFGGSGENGRKIGDRSFTIVEEGNTAEGCGIRTVFLKDGSNYSIPSDVHKCGDKLC